MAERDDAVGVAMDEEDRTAVGLDGAGGRDRSDGVAAGREEHVGGQPRQRVGHGAGERQARESERLAREPVRIRRSRGGHDGPDPRLGGCGQEGPDPAHRVAQDTDRGDVGAIEQRACPGERIGTELARGERQLLGRVRAVAADVERQHVEPRGIEQLGIGERAVPRGLPAVDQEDRGTRGAVAGRDPPCRQGDPGGRDRELLEREPEVAWVVVRRVLVGEARAGAIGLREAPRCDRAERERGGDSDRRVLMRATTSMPMVDAKAGARLGPGRSNGVLIPRARSVHSSSCPGENPMTSSACPATPPSHDQGRLAQPRPRAPSGPRGDTSGRRTAQATRRMAEINRAYDELCSGGPAPRNADGPSSAAARAAPSRADPPVTGAGRHHLDVPAAQHDEGPRIRHGLRPPSTSDRLEREPLRASQPTGPLNRRRQRNFRGRRSAVARRGSRPGQLSSASSTATRSARSRLRADLHRLARADDLARPGPRRRGARASRRTSTGRACLHAGRAGTVRRPPPARRRSSSWSCSPWPLAACGGAGGPSAPAGRLRR